KSLDRDAFDAEVTHHLGAADGAATLTAFTASSVAKARECLPSAPSRWLVTGGGRHNLTLCRMLSEQLGAVAPIETIGGRGDSLEAEAFAHLAVRTLRGLPISFPRTTGVPVPMAGGIVYRAG
ncbi:MAG: anhydro-N-acetylmuramic acid kinase, partial [Proteobacteria bacterium]|nr:anhydro-N-acetylmuramic acid kinase [Pseudomonadota bacterium]